MNSTFGRRHNRAKNFELYFPVVNSIRLNHHRISAAIVDLDGTMIDTLGDFDVALNTVLAELGLPSVDRGFISRTVGKGSEHLIRSTLSEVGAGAGLYDEIGRAHV